VTIPLDVMVAITGVSGLRQIDAVHDVITRRWKKRMAGMLLQPRPRLMNGVCLPRSRPAAK